MPDYPTAQDTALRLIADAGRSLPMSRSLSGTWDPVEGTDAGGEVLAWNVQAVVLRATIRNFSGLDNGLLDTPGGLVLSKARRVLIAAKDCPYEPRNQDRMVFDGSTWLVLACVPISPGGVPIIYTVGVMQA